MAAAVTAVHAARIGMMARAMRLRIECSFRSWSPGGRARDQTYVAVALVSSAARSFRFVLSAESARSSIRATADSNQR